MKKVLLVSLLGVLVVSLYAQEVTTIAGTGEIGSTDGPAADASFNNPHGIATDDQGTIYVAERYGHVIRKISASGVVTTLAGSGAPGNSDGTGAAATFNEPWGLCVGTDGNIYVADTKNNLIRKITPQGVVSTYAGSGSYGITDGPASAASFGNPTGIEMDAEGNLYVADHATHIIRKITPDGTVSRLAGSPYCFGLVDGELGNALFNRPYGLSIDLSGNVIVADEWNHAIRSIDAQGNVSTIAGNGTQGHIDGAGVFSTFYYPWDVTVDNAGNIFVMDGYNHSIRKLISNGETPATYGTLSFAGVSEESGWVDGYGTEAEFNGAAGIHYCKSSGEVFIADTYNNKIRKIIDHNEQSVLLEMATNSQGVICANEVCKARAFPANFDTYTFFVNGQIVQSGSNEIFESNNVSPGTHTIMVHGVNPQGSFISSEFEFTVLESDKPVVETIGELPMPEGSAIVLTTSGGISCVWSNQETTENITIEEPGVFTVDVLYQNGCVGVSDPINVQQFCSVGSPIIEYTDDVEDNECVFNAVMQTDFEGDIQWLKDGSPISGATGNVYETTEAGVYQIVGTAYDQQVYSNVLNVTISPGIVNDIYSNKTTIYSNSPKVKFFPGLDYYGYFSYSWDFGDPESGPYNTSTSYSPKHYFEGGVGDYTIKLTVTDLYSGCSQTIVKEAMIHYAPGFTGEEEERSENEEHIIYVPNAFSPNGDGENDELFVRGEEIRSMDFKVFNQKGKLVFESSNQSNGWDGTTKGVIISNETYNYVLKATMSNGDEEARSGKVFVIR